MLGTIPSFATIRHVGRIVTKYANYQGMNLGSVEKWNAPKEGRARLREFCSSSSSG
ncbi:MAG TPA: hypothetical protein VJK54_05280 [Chthoniobacterales bacterium]|nr:hypothetical protein [Chthoniobacterales bacterium]